MRGLLITLFLSFLLSYILRRFLIAARLRTLRKSPHETPVQDRFVACPACGTYNPMKAAYVAGGEYFCNEACFAKLRAKS